MHMSGALIELCKGENPLVLHFEYNPTSIVLNSSTRKPSSSSSLKSGVKTNAASEKGSGGLGLTQEPEQFSVKILLDATDRIVSGKQAAPAMGISGDIEIIKAMARLRSTAEGGNSRIDIASKNSTAQRAATIKHKVLPTLLFLWGDIIVPVQLISYTITPEAYYPTLIPYRAKANLTLEVVENCKEYNATRFKMLQKVKQALAMHANIVEAFV